MPLMATTDAPAPSVESAAHSSSAAYEVTDFSWAGGGERERDRERERQRERGFIKNCLP